MFAARHNAISSLVAMSMSSDETATAFLAQVRDAQNVLVASMLQIIRLQHWVSLEFTLSEALHTLHSPPPF